MRRDEWEEFCKVRSKFRKITNDLRKKLPNINVVYNNSLEEINIERRIKLIIVGDNPGRRELEQGKYLVGPSGKIANKFFLDNPSLGIDFNKNVMILNKTPIHTPRTFKLKELKKNPDKNIFVLLDNSQKVMANLLLAFQKVFRIPVFIIGYSEMKKGGIFESYTDEIKKLYLNEKKLFNKIYLFRHFSMNQFTIDLKKKALPQETVEETLKRIGADYRKRYFCS